MYFFGGDLNSGSSRGVILSSPTKTPLSGRQVKYLLFLNVPSDVPWPGLSWKKDDEKLNKRPRLQ